MNFMIRQLLFYAGLLWAAGMAAQQDKPVPTFSEMKGDYIIINSQEYEGVKNIANMKAMSIISERDSLKLSGFYMKGCPDFRAGYDETTGNLVIPSGTLIYLAFGEIYQYLYVWDDKKGEVVQKPILYQYKGNNLWETEETLMIMSGKAGEELSPYYFSQGSKIYKCNGKTENVSFVGWGQAQQRYDESRPSYVMVDNQKITIYNMLQADQFEYGCRMEGTYNSETGEASFLPSVIGQSNEGLYRVLTGCTYDATENKPTDITNPQAKNEGQVKVKVDMEKGTLEFEPMAIFPASLSNRGGLIIDKSRFFEFVKSVKVSFDPQQAVSISAPKIINPANKEIVKTEYYDITGRKITEPTSNTLVIQKIYYKDKTSKVQKVCIK